MSFVSPAAWGARHGSGLIRRALASGRGDAFAAVLAFGLLGVVFFGGVAVVVIALAQPPWAALLFALPATSCAAITVSATSHRIFQRRRSHRVELLTAPSGEPAIGFRRSELALVDLVSTPCAVAAAFVAVAVAGLRVGSVPWTLSAVLLALIAFSPVVPLLQGRVHPGGLYLTVRGVEHHAGVVSQEVWWEQLLRTPRLEPARVVLSLSSPRRRRSTRWWVARELTDQPPRDVFSVSTLYLHGDPGEVAGLVDLYLHRPDLRARLGEPPSSQGRLPADGR